MKFSLFLLPSYDPSTHGSAADAYEQVLSEAEYADANGYDSIWLAEHHFRPYGGLTPSVPVLLAAIAGRTKRLRLGSGGLCLTLHNPLELAEQMAMVDNLSRGRARMGVVRAFLHYEFEAFRVDMGESVERFREGVEVICGLMANEKFSYNGKFNKLSDVTLTPRPVQKPHPPIIVGTVMTRESFEYAGRNGFDLMVVPYITSIEEVAEKIGWYHAALREAGHDPADHGVMSAFHLYCDDDEGRAYAVGKKAVQGYLKSFIESVKRDVWSKDYKGYEGMMKGLGYLHDDYDLFRTRALIGTPAELVQQVEKYEKAGITELGLVNFMPAVNREQSMRSLELFTDGVMAKYRSTEAVRQRA